MEPENKVQSAKDAAPTPEPSQSRNPSQTDMGLVFSTASSFVATCIGSLASSALYQCCCGVVQLSGSIATRLVYAFIFLINSLFAWMLLSDWALAQLKKFFYGYLELNCPEGVCYGVVAVHRVCLAMALFHLVLAGSLFGVTSASQPRAKIQTEFWAVKIVGLILLYILAFFLPNGLVFFYGNYVAFPVAVVFILIQLVLLVDFAHRWSEQCIEHWEMEDSAAWKWILIVSTFGLLVVALVLTILAYVYFASPGCTLNQTFISINLILTAAICIASIHPSVQEENPRSGLGQAAMVAAYCAYLLMSALVNEPVLEGEDGTCNPVSKNRSTQGTTVILGAVFTFLALVYSTSRAASQTDRLTGDMGRPETVPLLQQQQPQPTAQMRHEAIRAAVASGALPATELPAASASSVDDAMADESTGYNYMAFHLIFACAAMYVAMLLTDWNTISVDHSELVRVGHSYVAVWFKIISGWVCHGIFAWTLFAPILYPDREWV